MDTDRVDSLGQLANGGRDRRSISPANQTLLQKCDSANGVQQGRGKAARGLEDEPATQAVSDQDTACSPVPSNHAVQDLRQRADSALRWIRAIPVAWKIEAYASKSSRQRIDLMLPISLIAPESMDENNARPGARNAHLDSHSFYVLEHTQNRYLRSTPHSAGGATIANTNPKLEVKSVAPV